MLYDLKAPLNLNQQTVYCYVIKAGSPTDEDSSLRFGIVSRVNQSNSRPNQTGPPQMATEMESVSHWSGNALIMLLDDTTLKDHMHRCGGLATVVS